MNIEKQQEMLVAIGESIYQAAPQGWVEAECSYRSIGLFGQCSFYVRLEGTEFQKATAPSGAVSAFMDLRTEMHRPETGAWFSSVFRVANNGDYRVECDYDGKPDFLGPGPSGMEFLNEKKYYPRSEEKTPEWLREGIRRMEGSWPS